MATSRHVEQFEQTFTRWQNIPFDQVYRDGLGSESFRYYEPTIQKLSNVIERTNLIKHQISDRTLSQVGAIYNQVINILTILAQSSNVDFIASKVNIQRQLDELNEALLNIWPSILTIINDTIKDDNADDLLKQIQNLTEKSRNDAKLIEDLKSRLSAELESFENRYKELFQRAELIKQTDIFSIQAQECKKTSLYWLLGVAFTSIALIVLLWFILKNFCFELSCYGQLSELKYDQICKDCNKTIFYLEIVKSLSYRLLIISFIVYLINFCVKNFNASMHNHTINTHKANSLNAALALLERAKTEKGNDDIMNQAASAIFSHQPTGYSTKDPENISNKLTEKVIEKIDPSK